MANLKSASSQVSGITPLDLSSLKVITNNSIQFDRTSVLSSFLNQFIKTDFLENIINVMLYQSDLNTANSKTTDTIKFVNSFLKEVYSEVNQNSFNIIGIPKNTILSIIKVVQQVVNLRSDISVHLLSYDTILQHFPKRDIIIDKTLRSVISNKLLDYKSFKDAFDSIVERIQFFNDFRPMKKSINDLGIFLQQSSNEETSIFSLSKSYKDIISNAYNDLINLKTLTKNEQIDDYVCIDDSESVKKVVSNLITFLESGYSFYKTGYPFIDGNILGIESSTMHLITGPSNHCKSIFMVNLARNMAINNPGLFETGDAIVYITLEDDIYKLIRRFMSIFGNTNGELIRQLFIKTNDAMKNINSDKTFISSEVSKILTDLINKSIVNTKDQKCKIVIKHCNENTFSMSDARKFMDNLKLNGINTKILLIDYVDTMIPSNQKHSTYNDYDAQGEIIQEMRLTARTYSLPVISITQNTRESENMSQSMGNNLVGD